jgi:hypothetical protein
MLLVIVLSGFAAMGGHLSGPKPDNFSQFDGAGDACPMAPPEPFRAANYAIALMQVLYSYSGWDSANYVRDLCGMDNTPVSDSIVFGTGLERG